MNVPTNEKQKQIEKQLLIEELNEKKQNLLKTTEELFKYKLMKKNDYESYLKDQSSIDENIDKLENKIKQLKEECKIFNNCISKYETLEELTNTPEIKINKIKDQYKSKIIKARKNKNHEDIKKYSKYLDDIEKTNIENPIIYQDLEIDNTNLSETFENIYNKEHEIIGFRKTKIETNKTVNNDIEKRIKVTDNFLINESKFVIVTTTTYINKAFHSKSINMKEQKNGGNRYDSIYMINYLGTATYKYEINNKKAAFIVRNKKGLKLQVLDENNLLKTYTYDTEGHAIVPYNKIKTLPLDFPETTLKKQTPLYYLLEKVELKQKKTM